MDTRNRLWPTLIGVGMVVYGVAAIWSIVAQHRVFLHEWIDWPVVITAALLVGVGGVALVLELLRQPDDERPHMLGSAFEAFVLAWRRLWGTKWLLWVYGSVAGVCVAGALVQQAFALAVALQRQAQEGQVHAQGGTYDGTRVISTLPFFARGAFGDFVQAIPSSLSPLVTAVVLVGLAIWILPRLSRLSGEPGCQGKTGFFAVCVVLAVLSAIAAAWGYVVSWQQIFGATAGPPRSRFSLPLVELSAIVLLAITTAVLMGGIIGALVRRSNGEAKGTFLADAVRYFQPLAGFYLLVNLALALPYIPYVIVSGRVYPSSAWAVIELIHTVFGLVLLLLPLLMFAPFGIVTRGLSTMQSIGHSFGVWKQTWRQSIALVGVGASLFIVSRAPGYVVTPSTVPATSWLTIPLAAVFALLGVLAHALIILAVWEFYQANVTVQEPASATL